MKSILTPDLIRKTCEPSQIKVLQQAAVDTSEIIIGQDRAAKALQFGLGIKADGYNIFVCGMPGTGRLTAVKNFVQEPAKKEPSPQDWCYVNSFKDPYQPTRLSLPPGKATALKKDTRNLIRDIHQALAKTFEHEDFINRRQRIIETFKQRQVELFTAINERAAKESILIEETPVDIFALPLKDGKPMSNDEFSALPESEKKTIRKKQKKYIDEIKLVLRTARNVEKESNEELAKLEKETATFAIGALMEEMEEKYVQVPDVIKYLKEIQEDILANLTGFVASEKEKPEMSAMIPFPANNYKKRYEVNVLVDNSGVTGAPVVLELNPTYNNLFGRVEKESHMGTWVTDLSLIRKGSLHTANGGYLIIRVEELFKNPFSWASLKRAMKNKEIVIEDAGDQWGFITTKTLKPESIPLHVKVILVGDTMFYRLLYEYDSDFKELFKVKADFDSSMKRTDETIRDYTGFCSLLGKKEGLAPMHEEAVAKVVEYGSRLAEDQNKLSTRFGEISDVIREANYYAMLDQSAEIKSGHIQKAVEEKSYRSNLIQEKLNEMIASRQILIDIQKKKAGQVNALSVIDLGDIRFGIPSRITCSTSMGKDGVVAIEREAELSGPIHTKGVMILSGYLAQKFIQDKPLSLNARIVFEQSYSGVEGDSASSSELYSILSGLSGLPIRQSIAVTGSVDQRGEVQAVGGVNEKIEGFFEACKLLGRNNEQGVMIPSANVRNLMLKEEIVEAVRQERFTIWAIDTIEDGIEILTGVKAGTTETPGSVFNLVSHSLNGYADRLKVYASEDGHETA